MDDMESQIRKAGKSMACRWWVKLNRWEWPAELPGKPEGFDEMPERSSGKGEVLFPIMDQIVNTYGKKACLKEWNK